jgi:hypothetical protein
MLSIEKELRRLLVGEAVGDGPVSKWEDVNFLEMAATTLTVFEECWGEVEVPKWIEGRLGMTGVILPRNWDNVRKSTNVANLMGAFLLIVVRGPGRRS